MINIAAGIDIGGTNTVTGLVDKNGRCYHQEIIQTDQFETASEFTGVLSKKILQAIGGLGADFHLAGIGIGAPNGNYYKGTIESAANLKWKEVIPVVTMMEEFFEVPIRLTNDANAAAMGEMIYGAAKGMKDFIMITLGTGLGSGIVVNGRVLYGHDGFAGELGHTIVEPGGRHCGCGRSGCLETYVSATGITRTVIQLLTENHTDSILRKYPLTELDSRKIYEAACQDDPLALKAFDMTCRVLGLSLANAVAFSSPEAIILFGGLAAAKEFINEPTRKYMEENLLKIFRNKVQIITSQLPENDAAILGSAALVWE